MKQSVHPKLIQTTFLSNILEHLDRSLFGLLAPFLAPLFFPGHDPIAALAFIYLPLGFLARPIGALFWGRMGDQYGRKKALSFSLLGLSLTCFLTASLPTHQMIGSYAPMLLYLCRAFFGFCSAGEGPGAALLLIESVPNEQKEKMSSFYEMSSVVGSCLGVVIIATLSYFGTVLLLWRYLFILSALIGLSTYRLRRSFFEESQRDTRQSHSFKELFSELWSIKSTLLCVIFVTGFSCSNLLIVTRMLNGYLPVVHAINPTILLYMHAFLMLFDFLFLPLMGKLAHKVGASKLILFATFLSFSLSWPFFHQLQSPTFFKIFSIRVLLIFIGIMVAGPFNAWAIHLLGEKHRFTKLSLTRAIGSKCIGGFSISLSLWLYQKTHWVEAPALFLMASSCLAFVSLSFILLRQRRLSVKKSF